MLEFAQVGGNGSAGAQVPRAALAIANGVVYMVLQLSQLNAAVHFHRWISVVFKFEVHVQC